MLEIVKGKIDTAKKVLLYGVEGIGKSTFASRFPDPLFIDIEGGTKELDVKRLQTPDSWAMLLEEVNAVIKTPGMCKTLVIDTIDWGEKLCYRQVCRANNWKSIETPGYGAGYRYAFEEMGRLLNLLTDAVNKGGVNVVVLAHATLRKFEQPDEMGAYDRWELKLQNSQKCNTAALLKEWADMVLFANYKTYVINVDNQGAAKGKNKAQGGTRVMYTTHHPCWDAKNRFGLPDELPFEFSQIAHILPDAAAAPSPTQTMPDTEAPLRIEPESVKPIEPPKPIVPPKPAEPPKPAGTAENNVPKARDHADDEPLDTLPPALAQLMRGTDVKPWEIRFAVALKGYFPNDMPISDYPKDFVDGCLVGAWDQMYACILKNRATMPF